MKKLEKKATASFKVILPAIYLAPMALTSWSFISFVQWAS
jgi:hypothetical protein